MKKFISIFAATGLILTGCGASDNGSDPGPAGKDAIVFDLGARTIAGVPELDVAFDWKSSDVMGIYCSRITATANYNAKLNGTSFTSDFKFKDTEEHTFYLYAPYTTTGSLSNKTPKITAELPVVQNAQNTLTDNTLVFSKTTVSPADGKTVHADFTHVFAYAGFKVTASQYSSYRLKAVKLDGDVALSGAYTADFQASNPVSFGSAASNSVTVAADAAHSLPMSAAQTVYLVLNPQTGAKNYNVTVDLENPADGTVTRFGSKVEGKTFPPQVLTTLELNVASMTEREDISIDFGQTSTLLWGGLASIEHTNVAALRNEVRTAPGNYGIRYRKTGSSNAWATITAVDGKSSTPQLDKGQTYDYEVWVAFKGQTYYSGNVLHFTEGVESRAFYKENLALKFTGLWCVNCPNMSVMFEKSQELWSDRIDVLEIHGGDIYEIKNMDKIASRYSITSYPTGIMDSRAKIENYPAATMAPSVVNVAKEGLANFTPACGITVLSTLDNKTLTVKPKIYVTTTDTFLLNVVLVEDRTTTSQTGYNGTFKLHNVARVFMTDILGDTMNASAGIAYEKTFTCTLPDDAVVDNCKVMIYVMRKYNAEHPKKEGVTGIKYGDFGGYYVDNCSIAKVGTQTLLKYEN